MIYRMSTEALQIFPVSISSWMNMGENSPPLRLLPGEVNMILSYFTWMFMIVPFLVHDGKKYIFHCGTAEFPQDQFETPGSPYVEFSGLGVSLSSPSGGARTCFLPVSNREIQLPRHLWQEGKDCTLKEPKMSGSYWADDSCLPTLISEYIMSQ